MPSSYFTCNNSEKNIVVYIQHLIQHSSFVDHHRLSGEEPRDR